MLNLLLHNFHFPDTSNCLVMALLLLKLFSISCVSACCPPPENITQVPPIYINKSLTAGDVQHKMEMRGWTDKMVVPVQLTQTQQCPEKTTLPNSPSFYTKIKTQPSPFALLHTTQTAEAKICLLRLSKSCLKFIQSPMSHLT